MAEKITEVVEILYRQQWIVIALIFFGIIGYIVWVRRRDRKWIDKRFGLDRIRAMSFGVNYFGLASDAAAPRCSSGFLLLLPDRLFYRSRITGLELEVPGDRIVGVRHGTSHKGVELHQSLVKVSFLDSEGRKECAAFKVPYPPQWISAIETTFRITGKRSST